MPDAERTVIAQANVTMDGMTAGPDGDLSWLIEHAVSPQMSAYSEGIWRGASTALMGRTTYEGYHGHWPPVAQDPEAAARDRELATWLDTVEKVVFSRTLEEASWKNSRVARDVELETRALKGGCRARRGSSSGRSPSKPAEWACTTAVNGPRSDNLIQMRRLTATEAARGFSQLLDQVEDEGETFVVERRGRAVASITPAAAVSGRAVKDLMRSQPADPEWPGELVQLRARLEPEERRWRP